MALDTETKRWMRKLLGDGIRFNETMARHTYFRVGGPAEAFATPGNADQLIDLVRRCHQRGIPYLVVGDGSNLLVRDGGIPGVVITLTRGLTAIKITHAEPDQTIIEAMAGARLSAVCRFAAANGLSGMNFAVGIPGTVGGAIVMNAGTAIGAMDKVISAVTMLTPDGQLQTREQNELDFGYRQLRWADPVHRPLILSGRFNLEPGDPEMLRDKARRLREKRIQSQPTQLPSAGCFFKNPAPDTAAGRLIDEAGLKGRRCGGAEISPRHANFIVNTGGATAADILELMHVVQETVYRMFNIWLETEVKIVGA